MKLSIVIPNYNGTRTIKKVLNKITEQVPLTTEILFVDDCSKDSSVEIVKENFPQIIIIQNEKNLGTATIRNIGINKTNGDWILFVDSDVILQSDCIRALLEESDKADILFPFIYYPNLRPMYPVNSLQASFLMISPVFIIRRVALDQMKNPGFDNTFGVYCEDTDFFLRAYLAGLTSHYCPNAEALHDVELNHQNREFRYFLELRNAIYGAIKFRGVKGISKFDHAFKISNIMKLVTCGLFNFNLFDMQARGYQKYAGLAYGLRVLFGRHDPLTPRGNFVLLTLSLKAILWNLHHLPLSLEARNSIYRNHSSLVN